MSIIHYDYAQIGEHLNEVKKQGEIIANSSQSISRLGGSIEWHDQHSADSFKATIDKLNKSLTSVQQELDNLARSAHEASSGMQSANEKIARSWG